MTINDAVETLLAEIFAPSRVLLPTGPRPQWLPGQAWILMHAAGR